MGTHRVEKMDKQHLVDEINTLKKEKNCIILAHNYQLPEIQDIADVVGDSLGLSRMAADTKADIIVFCGVNFMAETASIISPDKKVIIPDNQAGCSLADSISVEAIRQWKEENPGAIVVTYVNSTAEVKAESDYCCTSSNAVKVVQSIPKDKDILFAPDMYLGAYVQAVTGRTLNIWNGCCHIHKNIGEDRINEGRLRYPDAELLIHPECECAAARVPKTQRDSGVVERIFSTEGMLNHVARSTARAFLVATEVGILHRMRRNNPEKEFYPAWEGAVCEYMKLISLEKLLTSIQRERHEVKIPEQLAAKARKPIERMLAIL